MLHVASLVATAIAVVDAVQRGQPVRWPHFIGLGVGEALNLLFTLSVLLRTEAIPYLRMLWHVRRYTMLLGCNATGGCDQILALSRACHV